VGDGNIKLSWSMDDDSGVAGFVVAYAEDDGNCTALQEGQDPAVLQNVSYADVAGETATSTRVEGLTNGNVYAVAVASFDDYGNTSALSEPLCASPSLSVGAGDIIDADGEYCFIATAAFGSYAHPKVKVLRSFRDRFLAHLPGGNAAIHGYYAVGPQLAGWVHGDKQALNHLRGALTLFAAMSKALVEMGPVWFMVLLMMSIVLGLLLGMTVSRSEK
jgi:hypothetical protein